MATLPFQFRPGRPDDALAILAAHRSAVRQSAASAYGPTIIDEWAPAIIVTERVETFQRWIERGEELIVVATDSAGEVIGFGSIVPTNSELRAVYVDAAYGGQGVGRALLARLEELARDAGLTELRMDASINAVPFYEANGPDSSESRMRNLCTTRVLPGGARNRSRRAMAANQRLVNSGCLQGR